MKEIIKLGLILLIIAGIASGLLGMTYDVTYDTIQEQRRIADNQARQAVSPDADDFEAVSDDLLAAAQAINDKIVSIHKALNGDQVIGYVIKTRPSGFGGALDVIVGIDKAGTITGFRMGNHAETPGLGDNAKKPAFYEQYIGLTVTQEVKVNKVQPGDNEILAIAGATITSQAVTNGVNFAGDILDVLE